MSRTPPQGLLVSKTYRRPATSAGRDFTAAAVAPNVSVRASDTDVVIVRSTTSAVSFGTGLAFSTWFTPSITAPPAISSSMPTRLTWPHRAAITRAASSPWPSGWWSKTACPIEPPPGTFGAITASLFPSPPSRTGSRPREKKSRTPVETDYLDWALADFSGYLAADELYDGPFCVLSAVDARRQRRLLYEVLDRDPTHPDIVRFLGRLKDLITAHGGVVQGITTDGSPLYPEPIAQVFGGIPHQICEFHIIADLTKVVLRAVARLRKRLADQAPKLPRGRPKNTPEARRRQRRAQIIHHRITELFEHRHLFVRHHLTASQWRTIHDLSRGEPQLRALRAIMDEVYRLFDRRCRTDTALAKLSRLRGRVRRFRSLGKCLDQLNSPNLEKALTFLDDKLLPATSNAVERSNRRHRKMQKTIYRVRTKPTLEGRLALDLLRDQQASSRDATLTTLRKSRP